MDSIKAASTSISRPTSSAGKTYGSEQIQQVKTRAANFQQPESKVERRGMQRFQELTSHAGDLRRDVPRGFYLNIVV